MSENIVCHEHEARLIKSTRMKIGTGDLEEEEGKREGKEDGFKK